MKHTPPHQRRSRARAIVLGLSFVLGLAVVATPARAQDAFDESKGTTIFAFDQVSIPFVENLKLEMREPRPHPSNPVVPRGPKGSPDSWAVQFYGSIIRDNGKFRLWYVAAGDERTEGKVDRSEPWKVAYAESADGVKWSKPDLGLVEYRGGKSNNLVKFDNDPIGILNCKVLRDDDDADAARRYKMTAHVWFPRGDKRFGTLATFVSPDGLNWKSTNNIKPVNAELVDKDALLPLIHYEPCGGFYKWDGLYYINGQNAEPSVRPFHARVARTFVSGDFQTWEPESSTSLIRTPQHDLLGAGRSREGQQMHEGISVWNRGNVLLGIFGQWHGGKEWPDVTIDLGFAMSNDGVNFREPAHEFTLIKRGRDGEWDQGGVIQGQGFENVGDQTYVYYGAWDPRHWENAPKRGGVGIALLPRDRFGDLMVDTRGKGKGDYQLPEIDSRFLTRAISLKVEGPRRIFVNAEGLGADATLKFELLDEKLKPILGYSGEDAAVLDKDGFHAPLAFKGKDALTGLPARVHIRGTFLGKKNTDIRLSALYVQ